MAIESASAALEKRIREREEESARNAQMAERLRLAEEELERKDQQIEELFVQANALTMKTELARIELSQIFNAATDGMWIVDNQFNVAKINDALSRLFGKAVTDAVGTKCYDLFPCSLCQGECCPLRLIMNGDSHTEHDTELNLGDSVKSFLVTASHFRGLDNSFLGIVVSFKDITHRKRVNDELQKVNLELERLTFLDGLTQIANRRRFDETLRACQQIT